MGGAPLDPDRAYTVATVDYLVRGGDVHEPLLVDGLCVALVCRGDRVTGSVRLRRQRVVFPAGLTSLCHNAASPLRGPRPASNRNHAACPSKALCGSESQWLAGNGSDVAKKQGWTAMGSTS